MLECHIHRGFEHTRSCIADDDIEMTKLFGDDLEHFRHAVWHTNACLNRDRASAHGAHLGAHRLGFVRAVVVVGNDIATGGGQFQGTCTTDAACGAGHQSHFT